VCAEQRATYRELDARASQLAHFLRSAASAPDSTSDSTSTTATSISRCPRLLQAARRAINVNYRYVREELEYMFDNADMVACIHHREFVRHCRSPCRVAARLHSFISVEDGSAADLGSIGAVEYERALEGQSNARDFGERADNDLFILYTGGTTGMPRACCGRTKPSSSRAGRRRDAVPDGPARAGRYRFQDFTASNRGMPLAPLMHGACWCMP